MPAYETGAVATGPRRHGADYETRTRLAGLEDRMLTWSKARIQSGWGESNSLGRPGKPTSRLAAPAVLWTDSGTERLVASSFASRVRDAGLPGDRSNLSSR
jgi:hypothetical protein